MYNHMVAKSDSFYPVQLLPKTELQLFHECDERPVKEMPNVSTAKLG